MQNVQIRVVSTVTDDVNNTLTSENIYKGTMTEKNGKYYCMYEEEKGSDLEGTKTTIKWDQEHVILLRCGSLNHRQEFCEGLRDASIYQTPYMEIPIVTDTKFLHTYFFNGAWCLEMEYALEHSGARYGDMKIFIEIREEIVRGH
ncbi:MAG: DUF1934 domain-containing protein [Phascolarctobacterium sp.]|nr:DUF1934 domain-containing protein [Phascolarctobacterium sp.]